MNFFIDPILRAPTIGCMLMCLACSLIGVLVFVRRESLLGETVAHATYPGVTLAAIAMVFLPLKSFLFWGLLGSGIAIGLSLWLLRLMLKHFNLSADSALCFILTLFFGIGLTLSSYLQNVNSTLYKKSRIFLFGQAATITDSYLWLYFTLAAIIILWMFLFYREIQIVNLDPSFARSVGIKGKALDFVFYFLLLASVVIGIRSIGLFLLSGMLIGPAIAARQWTNRLHHMLLLSGLIGLVCGFLGVYISVKASDFAGSTFSFATGPTILIVSAIISFLSLIFSPKRGWLTRYLRIFRFKKRCAEENVLKSMWHFKEKETQANKQNLYPYQCISKLYYYILLLYMDFKGDLIVLNNNLIFTDKGMQRARHIVRMHRLWEVYLVHLGVGIEKVHHNAEEMEHIITPEIEVQLLKMMENPKLDPHNKPIPVGGS